MIEAPGEVMGEDDAKEDEAKEKIGERTRTLGLEGGVAKHWYGIP